MIPVAIFETIRHWHAGGMSRREIARRLNVDIKTVRRNLAKIEAGATAPARISPGSKLEPYHERIKVRNAPRTPRRRRRLGSRDERSAQFS